MRMSVFKAFLLYFFFNDTATTEIYTLSLHDALPICNGDVINLFGYELGPDLVESVLKLDLIQLSNLSCPVSLVGFTLSDKQVLSPALQALQSRLGARFAVEKIRPFWHEPRLYQPFQKQLVAASMELIPLEGSLERESR